MNFLIKLDRISAWVLFVAMILYFVSGYGMTKGLIAPDLARNLHLSLLTYIVVFAFIAHTCFAIHLALIRWNMWNIYTKLLLMCFYIVLFMAFIFIDKFYQPKSEPVTDNTESVQVELTPTPSEGITLSPSASPSPTTSIAPSVSLSVSLSPTPTPSATPTQKTFTGIRDYPIPRGKR